MVSREHICQFGLVNSPRHGEIEGPPVPDSVFQKQTVHLLPKIEFSLLILKCLLNQRATVLLRLIYQKGEHGEHRENDRQVLFSMSVVMLEVVYIPVLQCFEGLVLDGPSAAPSTHD